MTIVVQRVSHRNVQDTQALHHATVRHASSALLRGQTRTMTQGRDGARVVTYAETWVEGRRTARTVSGVRITSTPLVAVVEVGTKTPAAPLVRHAPASHPSAPAHHPSRLSSTS